MQRAILMAAVVLVLASHADAQSVSTRVSGAVGGVGSVAGAAAAGLAAPGGSQDLGSASSSSLIGGDAAGGLPVKLGDKTIKLRGNFGVEPDQRNFKAGVGLPF